MLGSCVGSRSSLGGSGQGQVWRLSWCGENKSMTFAVYVHVCRDHIFGMNVLRLIMSS